MLCFCFSLMELYLVAPLGTVGRAASVVGLWGVGQVMTACLCRGWWSCGALVRKHYGCWLRRPRQGLQNFRRMSSQALSSKVAVPQVFPWGLGCKA